MKLRAQRLIQEALEAEWAISWAWSPVLDIRHTPVMSRKASSLSLVDNPAYISTTRVTYVNYGVYPKGQPESLHLSLFVAYVRRQEDEEHRGYRKWVRAAGDKVGQGFCPGVGAPGEGCG